MCKIIKVCVIIVLILSIIVMADENRTVSNYLQLPPIETLILEPIEIENFSIWVPAAKTGPIINRSCRIKDDCSFICGLSATVNHEKTKLCAEELARLLAEHTACYHEKNLPLTIFNGWQWEYSYSLNQFDSVNYDLAERGGSWENCWEAILNSSMGFANSRWIQVPSLDNITPIFDKNENRHETNIEVKTFSYMRTRDGYPKIRKLE